MKLLPLFALALLLPMGAKQDENPLLKDIKSKIKSDDKPFVLMVTFTVKADKNEAFEKHCAPCVSATAKEPGCIAYQLNQDPDHPEIYVLYERWKSVGDLAKHLEAEHTKKLLAGMGEFTASGTKLKIYRAVE